MYLLPSYLSKVRTSNSAPVHSFQGICGTCRERDEYDQIIRDGEDRIGL